MSPSLSTPGYYYPNLSKQSLFKLRKKGTWVTLQTFILFLCLREPHQVSSQYQSVSMGFSSAPHPWSVNIFPSQRAVPINTKHIHSEWEIYTEEFYQLATPNSCLHPCDKIPVGQGIFLEYRAKWSSVSTQAKSYSSSFGKINQHSQLSATASQE